MLSIYVEEEENNKPPSLHRDKKSCDEKSVRRKKCAKKYVLKTVFGILFWKLWFKDFTVSSK